MAIQPIQAIEKNRSRQGLERFDPEIDRLIGSLAIRSREMIRKDGERALMVDGSPLPAEQNRKRKAVTSGKIAVEATSAALANELRQRSHPWNANACRNELYGAGRAPVGDGRN